MEVKTITERINVLIDGKDEEVVKQIFLECLGTYNIAAKNKKCPNCETELEPWESDDNCVRLTCKECGVFVDITEIHDKEVLDMIDYKDEDTEGVVDE